MSFRHYPCFRTGNADSARAAALLLVALAFLATLSGCGGGSDTTSTSATTASTAQPSTITVHKQAPHGKQGGAAKPKQEDGAGPVPGTKAVAPGVPVTKGGDNSIQVFGAEGETDQRAQAAADLKAYLSAFRGREWSKACALASQQFRQQLALMVAQARVRGNAKGHVKKPKGCAATLRLFFGKSPEAELRVTTQVGKVLSFRVRGGYAYVIFKGAGGKVMFIAMADDGGQWKVNVFQPQVFSAGT